jgi:hypothetical protein
MKTTLGKAGLAASGTSVQQTPPRRYHVKKGLTRMGYREQNVKVAPPESSAFRK